MIQVLDKRIRNMPFIQRTICNDSMMMVYSKNALTNLDTLCYNNAIAIVGDFVQGDNNNGIKVLSSLLIGDMQNMAKYDELNSYINRHCVDQPFLRLAYLTLKMTIFLRRKMDVYPTRESSLPYCPFFLYLIPRNYVVLRSTP